MARTIRSLPVHFNRRPRFRWKILAGISRKFIVNFDAVTELRGTVSTGLEVRLGQQTEHELAVSRERAADLKGWLDR